MPKGSGFSEFVVNKSGPAKAYSSAVISDAPRGYWCLDEASGNFVDSSGFAHTATPTGGVTYSVAGAKDELKAITLNGTTGYLSTPDHADFDTGDVFTLEIWLKRNGAVSATNLLLDKGTGGYRLELDTDQKVTLRKFGTGQIAITTVVIPDDGAWHHLVATKNGATVKLYLDGVDVTGTVTNQTITDTATNLFIGADIAGAQTFNGSIDEVAVYATALTAARVLAHYQARIGVGVFGSGASASVFVKSGSGVIGPSALPDNPLDDFNRADGVLTSPWVVPAYGPAGQLAITGNQIGGVTNSFAHYTGVGPLTNCFAYIDVPVLPIPTGGMSVFVRMNGTTGAATGYRVRAIPSTSAWEFRSGSASSSVVIATLPSQAFNAGDSIGISVVGSLLIAWHRPSGGQWHIVGSFTDTANPNGYLGFGVGNNSDTARVDNFNGGVFLSGTIGSGTAVKTTVSGTTYTKAGYATTNVIGTGGSVSAYTKTGSGAVGGPLYSTVILEDAPYLFWRLDDPSGTTAADSSENGRTATYSGSPTLAQPPLIGSDSSVLFDAVNDYALLTSGVLNTNLVTVEAWFYYDGVAPSAGQYWYIGGFTQGDAGALSDKNIVINSSHRAVFHVFDGSAKYAVGATALTAGIHHLVGTYDGTTARIYVDGVLDGSIAAASTYTSYSAPNILVGGLSAGFTAVRKAGRRDEFAIYTTALNATRIARHYSVGRGTIGSGPSASVFVKTGNAKTNAVGTGGSASIFSKNNPNLFPNPSVENDLDSWGSWFASSVARSNVQAHDGTWSVRVTGGNLTGVSLMNKSGATGPSPLNELIPVLPNTQYTWTAWVRADVGGDYYIQFQEMNSAGTWTVGTPVHATLVAGVWTKLSVTVTTAAATNYTCAFVLNSSGVTDSFYVDDAQLLSSVAKILPTVGVNGSSPSASVNQETGFSTVGGVGSGTSFKTGGTVYTKTGFSTISGVGAGPSASVINKTGFSTVGDIGVGASGSVTQETGYATAGSIGTGASASVFVKSGNSVAGVFGLGPSASVFGESGFATTGSVASGISSKAGQQTKKNFAVAGVKASGARNSISNKTGYATVSGVATGSRSRVITRSGFAASSGVATGASASVFTEAGSAITGGVGRGVDQANFTRQNIVISPAVLSGADAITFARKNISISVFVLDGLGLLIASETGIVISARVASGTKERTRSKTGIVIGSRVASGKVNKALSKTGMLIVERVLAGVYTYFSNAHPGHVRSTRRAFGTHVEVYSETGKVISGRELQGKKFAIFTESGIVIASFSAKGIKTRFITKSGFANWRGIVSGFDRIQFTESGKVDGTWLSKGLRQRTSLRTGLVKSALAALGLKSVIHPKTGAVVIQNSRISGVKLRLVPRAGHVIVTVASSAGRHHTAVRAGIVKMTPLANGNFAIDFNDDPSYFERTLLEVIVEAPELISAEGVPEPTLEATIPVPRLTGAQR